jgi:hypothetical protein
MACGLMNELKRVFATLSIGRDLMQSSRPRIFQRPKEAKMTADSALVTTAGLSASISLRSDAGVAQVKFRGRDRAVVRPGSPPLARCSDSAAISTVGTILASYAAPFDYINLFI